MLIMVGSEIRVSDKYVRLFWQRVYHHDFERHSDRVGQLAGESIQFDVKLSLQLNIDLTASLSKIPNIGSTYSGI